MNNPVNFKFGTTVVGKESGIGNDDLVVINEGMNEADDQVTVKSSYGSIYKGSKMVGTTKADSLYTTEEITIAGGPLANNIAETNDIWPSEWKDGSGNNVIPAGVTLQDVLSAFFLKVVEGSVSWGSKTWNPKAGSPSVVLSSNGPVEVGTKVKVTTLSANSTVTGNTRSAVCTASHGYYASNAEGHPSGNYISGNCTVSKDGSVSGTPSLSCTWNGNAVDITVNSTELEVASGTNTLAVSQSGQTASVDALPTTKVFAATNTKQVVTSKSATLTDTKPADKALTSSANDTIEGKYKYFIGCYDDNVFANKVYDDTNIRTTDVVKSDWMNGTTINYTITVPAGTKGMYIAIPAGIDDSGETLKVKQVNTNAYVNSEMVTNKRTLSFTCGGTHKKDYVIFTWSFPGGTTGEEPFEITKF